jgi:hypothetical protein
MSDKTIYETEATYGERAAGILRSWYEARDEIVRSYEPVEGGFSEYLTDEGRAQVVRERKAERASAEAENYRREYRQLVEENNARVQRRRGFLGQRLFKVAGTPGEAALPFASIATEEQLLGMLEDSVAAGSLDQAHAVFVVARRRQLPDVMGAYFEKADPEARELYREWEAAPSDETLEHRLVDIETMIAPPSPADFAAVPTFGGY